MQLVPELEKNIIENVASAAFGQRLWLDAAISIGVMWLRAKLA